MAGKKIEFTFGINSSNFNKNITTINNQMKVLRNEMQQASNDIVKSGNSLTTLANKYKSIENAIEGAKNKVKLYDEQIKKTNDTLEKNKKKLSELGEQKEKTNKLYDQAVEKYGKESEKAQTLKAELDKLNTQYKEQENRVSSNEKSIERYTVQLSNAETEVSKLEAELAQCNKEIQNQANTFVSASERLQTASDKMKAIGGTIDDVSNKILGISTVLVTAGIGIAKLSQDFEQGIAKINTLLDNDSNLQGYSDKIMQLSNDYNMSLSNMSDGMYQAISSLGDLGKETENIFDVMAKSAKAGGADVSDSVSLISSAMKGYGSVNEETAQKVSDLAFQTAKLGVTTFPEMAKSMQPLFPLANTLNISMEELFGTMATATGVVGNTAEVSTMLKATFSNLIKPTTDMTELMEKYGYANGQAMLETEGLQGMLKILQTETGGQSDKLGELFSSTEALTLVNALMGTQFDTLVEKTGAMNEAVGATDTAFDKITSTSGEKLSQSLNKLKNAFVTLGDALAPSMESIAELITKVAECVAGMDSQVVANIFNMSLWGVGIGTTGKAVASLTNGISVILSGLSKFTGTLGGVTTATNTAGTAIGGLSGTATVTSSALGLLGKAGAFLTSPAGWVIGGITALAGLKIAFDNTQKSLDNSTEKFKEASDNLESFTGKVRTSDSVMSEVFGKEITIKFSADFEEAKETVNNEHQDILRKLQEFYQQKYNIDHDGCTDEQEHQEHLRAFRESGEREHFKLLYEQRAKLQNHRSQSLDELASYLNEEFGLQSTSIGEIQGEYTQWYNTKAQLYDENWAEINEITKNATLKNRELTVAEQEEITKLLEENQGIQLELIEGSAEDRYNAYLMEMTKEKTLLDERSKNHKLYEEDIQTAMWEGFQEFSSNIDEKRKKIQEMDTLSEEKKNAEIKRYEQMQLAMADFTNIYGVSVNDLIKKGYNFSDASSEVFKGVVDDLNSGKINARDFGLTTEQYMAMALEVMANAGASADDLSDAIKAIPTSKRADVIASVQGKSNADALKQAIDNLKDKTVYVKAKVTGLDAINYTYVNGVAVPKAVGDASINESGMYLTQEKGWELIDSRSSQSAYSLASSLQGELTYVPEGARIQTNVSSTQQMKQEINKEVNRAVSEELSKEIKWLGKTIVKAINENGGADVDITNHFDITNNEKVDGDRVVGDIDRVIKSELRKFGKIK